MNGMAKLFVPAMAVVLLGAACSSEASTPENPGSTQPSATAGSVAVTLSEFAVSPNIRAVPAGSVTFSVTNTGKLEHEFVILRTSTAADALPQKGTQASEAGHVDEIEGIKARPITISMNEPTPSSAICPTITRPGCTPT